MSVLSSMANYNEKTISKIEFNFFKKFKMQIPEDGELKFLEWNHNNNRIVCGGTGGALRILQLNFNTNDIDAQALGMNQPLQGHEATVLSAQWNENYETIVSRDETGQVGVWHLKDDVWQGGVSRPGRCQGTVIAICWNYTGTRFAIVTENGNVLVVTVEGEMLWGRQFEHRFVFCEWYPDGDLLMLATEEGKVVVYDEDGGFYTDVNILFRHPLAQIMYIKYWSPTLESQFSKEKIKPEPNRILEPLQPIPDDRYRLVIALNCGTIQFMRSIDDERPFLLHLPLIRITAVKWAPNGAFLAVCGTDFYNQRHSRIYFISAYGNIAGFFQHFDIKINAISWEACGLRLAIASDGYVWVGNVRPEFKWGLLGDQLVYVFQTEEVDQYKIIFYDLKTETKSYKVVKYFEHLTCYKDQLVVVTRQESPGKHNCQLTIGPNIQNVLTTVYPNEICMNEKCLVVTNMNSYFIWNYNSVYGWATGEYCLEKQLENVAEVTSKNKISTVCIGDTFFLMALVTDGICRVNLADGAVTARYPMDGMIDTIKLNCDLTRLAVLKLHLQEHHLTIHSLSDEKLETKFSMGDKDIWSFKWDEEKPTDLVFKVKQKLVAFSDFATIEQATVMGNIVSCKDGKVVTVNLDNIMLTPENPTKASIKETVIKF